jgi:hypothetical protein
MMEKPEIVKPNIQITSPSGEDPTLAEESYPELIQKYRGLHNQLDDQTIFSTANNTTKYFATKADANREFRLGEKKNSCQLPSQSELMIQTFELNTPDLTRLMRKPVPIQSTREIPSQTGSNRENGICSAFQTFLSPKEDINPRLKPINISHSVTKIKDNLFAAVKSPTKPACDLIQSDVFFRPKTQMIIYPLSNKQ